MPKVSIYSPAPITRRKVSQVEYIISYKQSLAIRSKPTLFLQRQRKRSRHERSVLTPPHPSALVIDSTPQHSVAQSDVPFTKASPLAEHTNAFRGDIDVNPHRWSPTVLRKRKKSPVPISFQLSFRKTALQKENQPTLQLRFSSGEDKSSSKPPWNEAICHQQPRTRSDSAALREWIACVIFGFALRSDQRHQPPLPVSCEAVAAVAANIKCLFQTYALQDDVVFLALWYASHMMPLGLLDQFDLYQPDGIVLATRLFVLCHTLAIKWLADESYSLQSWAPHYQKGFSLSSAKALDKAAMELLDYNLYISPSQWIAWLHHLDEWPSTNIFAEDRIHLVAQARIRKLLFKSEASSPFSLSRSISTSGTAVWKLHKILLENLAISIPFPEPAPWNPAEDPIIHTTGRRQPFTQAPSPWSCGTHCSTPPQHHVPPLVVYNSKGEVQADHCSAPPQPHMPPLFVYNSSGQI